MKLHWGIAGCGKISSDFLNAMQFLQSEDHEITAVAARSKENAEKFAKQFGAMRTYDKYDLLASDPNINIVYIGVLNNNHYDLSKMMLENGKHVLCEKPMTMNENQTTKLVALAKEKGLFLQEAIWSRFFPIYEDLRKKLDQKAFGNIRNVFLSFGTRIAKVPRVMEKDLGGGAVLDIGIYALQFQQLIFKGLKPISIEVNGSLNESKVEDSAFVVIKYPDDKMAVLNINVKTSYPNDAVVIGTEGFCKIPSFWRPTEMDTSDGKIEHPFPKCDRHFYFANSLGLMYEIQDVHKCISAGLKENPLITLEESVELSRLMDEVRKRIGVDINV